MGNIGRHNEEIQRNLRRWEEKPALRRIYKAFYELIAENITDHSEGLVVELGSGIGNIKEVIPRCIRTDLFANPWIDRIENTYSLSFTDASLSDLILFDVFHHLRFPGTALSEFHRVLVPGGRVIIFEPCVSVLGFLVFGLFHDEPLNMNKPIQWFASPQWSADKVDYYAAQGNASRIFLRGEVKTYLSDWKVVKIKRLSAISYVASGGYSKPQLYPDSAFGVLRFLDRICDLFPSLFATRLLVILERKRSAVGA